MKNPAIPIIVFIIIAAIVSVEMRGGEVYNPLPGDSIGSSDTSSGNDSNRPDRPGTDDGEKAPAPPNAQKSPYANWVRLEDQTESEYSSAPGRESITISLSRKATEPITLTGWQIWSVGTGARATIPSGTLYPRESGGGPISPIVLNPGEKAIVYTGRSPLETSFKANICLPYLHEKKQLPRGVGSRCPAIEDIALPIPFFDRNDECEEFIEDLPSCAVPDQDEDFPRDVTRECQNYVESVVGYDNCVHLRQHDEEFLLEDWFVYLDRPAKLYEDSGEQVLLFDENGVLVDSY